MKKALLSLLFFVLAATVYCEGFDQEITAFTGKLIKQLSEKGIKKVAFTDFTDMQGRSTELGRYISEQVSVELVSDGGATVIDRANIQTILDEHNLTLDGLVKPENAKKFGEFSGVNAIIIGSAVVMDKDIQVTAKVISTDSAAIVAAAKMRLDNNPELQQLSNKGTSSGGDKTNNNSKVDISKTKAGTIAEKEIGDLKIMLKNVRLTKNESGEDAVQCVLETGNTNINEAAIIAAVGIKDYTGVNIQTQLIDSTGNSWELSDVKGLSYIRGDSGADGTKIIYSIKNGENKQEVSGYTVTTGGFYTGAPPSYWYGNFTEIKPGDSIRSTLTYTRKMNQQSSGKSPKNFQFEIEVISGTGSTENPENCEVNNIMFDEVVIPKK